jgi:hypothetical protein
VLAAVEPAAPVVEAAVVAPLVLAAVEPAAPVVEAAVVATAPVVAAAAVSMVAEVTVSLPSEVTAPLLILLVSVDAALLGIVAVMTTLPAATVRETSAVVHPLLEAISALTLSRTALV